MMVPLFFETFYKRLVDGIEKSGQSKKVERGVKLSQALLKIGIDKRRKIFKEILNTFGGNLKYIISGGAPLNPFYVKELNFNK